MKIDILTLFPDMFTPVTQESILGRAKENGILNITTNIGIIARINTRKLMTIRLEEVPEW